MKYKVGDEVRVKRTNKETMYKHIEGTTVLILNNVCNDLYRVIDCVGGQWILDEEMLEPAGSKTLRMADGTIIGEFGTGDTLPTNEWFKLVFKNGSSIEALPQKDNTVRGENHFCSGFRGGKIPTPSKPVSIEEQLGLPKGVSIHDLPTSELIKKEFNVAWIDKIALPTATETKEMVERVRREILKFTNAFPKEEKKMPTKFTFYTTDWTDIDKSNGKKIPMKTTYAYIGSYQDERADTSCPVSEYDERIGCLIAAAKISAKKSNEAQMMYNIARNTWGTELSWAILFELANTALNGNFERTYKKFHNDNIRFEKKRLTCSFCGKVFDTVEEKQEHENEHIQNKKNKREKYLIRKEAKRRLAEAEREGKIEQTMKELYKK